TAVILAAARRYPLVLALEDLQRADAPSLSWIHELLSAVSGEAAQLVIVLTATEPIALPAANGLETTAILLRPIAPEAATALFGSRLGLAGPADSWPSALRGLGSELARKAGGNPFFLTELLRTVISNGTLTRDGDQWAVGGSLASLELPPTLKGSVAAKLDRLVPAARRLLGIAAALDGPFDLATLTILAQGDAEPGVRLLAAEGLLDAIDPAGTRFTFVQEVFRDAAYQGLLTTERASIHARIAAYIQSSFGELQEEYSGTIADHLTKARDFGKALRFAYRAALFAGEGGAAREAVRRYRQCLEVHERLTAGGGAAEADAAVRLPVLLASLVEAEERLGNYQDAIVHSNQLLAQDLDEETRMAALRRLGSLQEQRGNFDDALTALRQGLELGGKRGSTSDQAALLSQMGTIELRRGELDEAIRLGESALNVLGGQTERYPEPAAYAHSLIGIAFYRMGDWERSIDHHRKALVLREEARDAFGMMRSLNNLGNTYVDYGRFDQAEKLYRQALGVARKENAPPALAQVLNNLGHLQML
ncbi:MAG: tetratricopeptide repeat protein, partial [Candidatus Sericytochromatia bacterium]|nr:tetratricopeptide repeat protein [Candidatus Tanganyikabacteria bacterium]